MLIARLLKTYSTGQRRWEQQWENVDGSADGSVDAWETARRLHRENPRCHDTSTPQFSSVFPGFRHSLAEGRKVRKSLENRGFSCVRPPCMDPLGQGRGPVAGVREWPRATPTDRTNASLVLLTYRGNPRVRLVVKKDGDLGPILVHFLAKTAFFRTICWRYSLRVIQ